VRALAGEFGGILVPSGVRTGEGDHGAGDLVDALDVGDTNGSLCSGDATRANRTSCCTSSRASSLRSATGNDHESSFFAFTATFSRGGGEGFFGVEYEASEKFGDAAANDASGTATGATGAVAPTPTRVVSIPISFSRQLKSYSIASFRLASRVPTSAGAATFPAAKVPIAPMLVTTSRTGLPLSGASQ
jgi:hypothetical protein